MKSLQILMGSRNRHGTSCNPASLMDSGKLWSQLSSLPHKRSEISKFLYPQRLVAPQPETKLTDLIDKTDENPIGTVSVENFDSSIKEFLTYRAKILDSSIKNIEQKVRDSFVQDVPMAQQFLDEEFLSTYIRQKQNYAKFQEISMGILDEVKHKAKQAQSLNSDIEEIKNEVNNDYAIVMKEIYDANVSIPEVDWNENSSIELTWFLKTRGTSTIVLYGDNHVVYNVYAGPDNYIRSVWNIKDNSVLPKLIGILSNITD